MEKKTLFSTPWLELKQIDGDNFSYVFSHEKRCNGAIVAVLPFRKNNGFLEYMLRSEYTPPWGESSCISSITGGVDDNTSIVETALHEVKEEAGYEITIDNLIDLEHTMISKSADTIAYLYAVDVSDLKPSKPQGDGSYLETQATSFWTSSISKSLDPLVYVMHYRLKKYLD